MHDSGNAQERGLDPQASSANSNKAGGCRHTPDCGERGNIINKTEQLERVVERLRLAQEAAGIGIHDYDIVNDRIDWDARTRQLWGVGPSEPISYKIFAAGVHPADLAAVEAEVARATDPAGDGRYFAQYRVRSRDGTHCTVEATGQTRFEGGQAVRMIGTVRDISAEVGANRALDEARAFAQNLIDSAPTLLYIYDLVEQRNIFISPQIGLMTHINPRAYRDLGDKLLATIIHPDDLDRITAHHRAIRARAIEPPFEIEYRVRRADGNWLWMASRDVVHRRDEDGRPRQILGASLDITQRREAEALRDLLLREMDHRVKNVLAVVQSVAMLTLQPDCDPATWQRFQRRLESLSAGQRLLTEQRWETVDLAVIVDEVLLPFQNETRSRIRANGPPVEVSGADIMTVALALHELATNAVKYGALSSPIGWVELEWQSGDEYTDMRWTERGGPPVIRPNRSGFGSLLLESLGGRTRFDYRPDGLVCAFSLRTGQSTKLT